MIFSAGLGTRFKPWTDKYPKALAMVNGKSLLQRNVEYLQKYGITEVVVNVHHFASQVIDAIEANKGWGSKILISDESKQLLETGGGMLHAKELLKDSQPFITLNVDILTDLNISKLVAFHEKKKAFIAFGITDRKTSRYFLFDEEDRLCGWRNVQTAEEKVAIRKPNLREMAYSCVSVFSQNVFEHIHQQGKFSITEPYLSLAEHHLILGYDHTGDKLVDVGKPESVAVAEELFND